MRGCQNFIRWSVTAATVFSSPWLAKNSPIRLAIETSLSDDTLRYRNVDASWMSEKLETFLTGDGHKGNAGRVGGTHGERCWR